MDSAESELQRRKERGRSSQAAFRKRQAKAIEDIKEEHRRLKEALNKITEIARSDDRPELVSVIRHVAGNVGIDVAHLTPVELDSDSTQGSSLETSASRDQFPPESSQLQCRAAAHQKRDSISSDEIDSFLWRSRLETVSSGAWMNPFHYMHITNPPDDIKPYIGDARFSLAGQIFWSSLERGRSVLGRRKAHKTWNDIADPIFRHMVSQSPLLTSLPPNFVQAMFQARLEYRNLGYITDQYAAAAEVDSGAILHKMVKADFLARGEDPSTWLTATAVELRVRAMLGSKLFAMLDAASHSPEASTAHRSVKGVVDKLVDKYVCFGEGPRWAGEVVDEVMREWVRNVVT